MIRTKWRQEQELEAAQAPCGQAQYLSPLFFLISCTPGHSRSSPLACAFQPLGLSSHVPSPRNDLIPHMSVSQAPGQSFSSWFSQEWSGHSFSFGCPLHKSVLTRCSYFSLQDHNYRLLLGNFVSDLCFYPESILVNYESKKEQVQEDFLNIQI